ncbi:hypothetical protein LBMAG49_15370 [Planctomycetota bacterium]|nr:hypothetical protein LBMAG49_15370 [Planctomycetota bacterium]
MTNITFRAFVLAATMVACSPFIVAQKGTPEPRAGLEFKPPKGFVEMPAAGDNGALVRLFAAPRALSDKEDGAHTPLMRVMFFGKGGNADKDVVDGLPRMTPFRGLEDFVQRGLGMKNPIKETYKVAALDGQRITGKDKARTLYGQSVTLPDGEAAVCFEALTTQFDKLKKDYDVTLSTLALVQRVAEVALPAPWLSDAEWNKKDLLAHSAARKAWAEAMVASAVKTPGAGFKVQKSKYWTVISAADPAFTKKAVTAAEMMRMWAATKMPDLTKESLPAILRIFDSMDHYRAYLTTVVEQREFDQGRRELLFAMDTDNGGNGGYGPLFRAVLWQVFADVDERVLPTMPRWFDNGISEFLRSSYCDGKKLEFMAGDVEKGRIAYYPQNKLPMPYLWHLIQEQLQLSPADGKAEEPWGYTPECARLMRWLWSFDGEKQFEKPNLVADYVRGLAVAVGKLGANPTLDVRTAGLSPSEQKEFNMRAYKWRDALLKDVDYTVLPLTESQWKAINEKWLEFNKNFK